MKVKLKIMVIETVEYEAETIKEANDQAFKIMNQAARHSGDKKLEGKISYLIQNGDGEYWLEG